MSKFVIDISSRLLHFKQPAGTSRGTYLTRKVWYITLTSEDKPGVCGVGECAPLPHLSCDDIPEYEKILHSICDMFSVTGKINYEILRPYPSILFGLETALRQWENDGSTALSNSAFARGQVGIPMNGLVWMGTFEEMHNRINEKISQGFRCIKLKIGAIDFLQELELIKRIRQDFSSKELELRLDVNGGFTSEEALNKLEQLALFDIHSVEQPIASRQWKEMAELCRQSPIPIALDEELIGVNIRSMKEDLLEKLKPAYIILKPSLHGGVYGTREWIELAQQQNIGSWITSALESNVGLNAIAHLTIDIYGDNLVMPQGLGTGQLFENNVEMPLVVKGERLWYLVNS